MKIAIICYDLKNVQPYTNLFVKVALAKSISAQSSTVGVNVLPNFEGWIHLTLPDTTLWVEVSDAITALELADHVKKVINEAGAQVNKIYVAFIDPGTDFLYNSEAKRV